MSKSSHTDPFRRVNKLIDQGKLRKAIPLLEELIKQHPDEPFLYQDLAMCYEETGQIERGIAVAKKAAELFPHNLDILIDYAEILYFNDRFQEAEQVYHNAIAVAGPELKREQADLYVGLGEALWGQSKRDEALEAWKKALELNPNHEEARAQLELFTNEYGEPSRFGPFDDVWHFHKIMSDRYFKQVGRTEFETKKEAERIHGAIMQAWNESVAPRSKELDTMTAAEKTEFFESIQINYNKPFQSKIDIRMRGKPKKEKVVGTAKEREFLRTMDARFGFLPPSGGVKLLLFGTPALFAVGFRKERFQAIMKGDRPTREEEEQCEWAYDLVETILRATYEKGNPEEVEAMMEAMEIAREELDEQGAVLVVQTIRQMIETIDKEKL